MAEAADFLLNALKVYREVSEGSEEDRLRLVATDAGQALKELAMGPERDRTKSVPFFLDQKISEKVIDSDLRNRLAKNYENDDGLRNKAVHQMSIPNKVDVELFLNDLRDLFRRLTLLPPGADSIGNLETRELGFRIPCPNAWDIYEANSVVHLRNTDANVSIRLHKQSMADVEKFRSDSGLTVRSRPIPQLPTSELSVKKLEYAYPEATHQTVRLIYLIEYQTRVYEFDYDPNPGLFDRNVKVFQDIVRRFNPLPEPPLNSHLNTVRAIAERYFQKSDMVRLRAQRELAIPTIFIDDLEKEGEIQAQRRNAALEKIIRAFEPLEQAKVEQSGGNISDTEYDLLTSVNKCLSAEHERDGDSVTLDVLHPDILLYGKNHNDVFLACVVAPVSTLTAGKILTWKKYAEKEWPLWICIPREQGHKSKHLPEVTKAEKIYHYFPQGDTVVIEKVK